MKVDEIGVFVGQKERPHGLSVGSRSASDKKVVPRSFQDKIRIGSLIYRLDRRRRVSQTGSSSHREPGIGGWQLELVQAYTIHTHFRHIQKMCLVVSVQRTKKSFVV